jgi:hypothetical protein
MSKALNVRRSFSVKVVQNTLLVTLLAAFAISGLIADLRSRLVLGNKFRKSSSNNPAKGFSGAAIQRPATSDAPAPGGHAGTPG